MKRNGGIIAIHDCKQAANSPQLLGTMASCQQDIPIMNAVKELDSSDSLVICQVNR